MPDVLSIGLGGGSLVDAEACTVSVQLVKTSYCRLYKFNAFLLLQVGPVSVGYRLEQEAQVFGGKTLTATDIAVMASMTNIGTCRPASSLTPDVVSAIVKKIHSMVEEAADKIKVIYGNNRPVHVLLL